MRTLLSLLLLTACGSAALRVDDTNEDPDDTETFAPFVEDTDKAPGDTDIAETDLPGGDTDVDPGVDNELYAGAWLDVSSPEPATLYSINQPVPLRATVRDADDEPLGVTEVRWSLGRSTPVLYTGLSGGITLEPGTYDLLASVELPNGATLQTVVGGVLVQAPRTGIYVGNILITAISMIQGQEIRTPCVGALDFTVDTRGEGIVGSGGCTLNLPAVGGFDLSYDLTGEISGPAISGDILIDVGITSIPIAWEGGFLPNGDVQGVFEGDAVIFDIEGEIEAHRITTRLP